MTQPLWLERLILKYGVPTVLAVGLALVLVVGIGLKIGWQKAVIGWKSWRLDTVTEQRDTARAQVQVEKKNTAQVEGAAQITAETRATTDAWLAWQRAQAQTGTEVIRERIREVPVRSDCVPPADPVVLQVVADARARAEAAAAQVRGTPAR